MHIFIPIDSPGTIPAGIFCATDVPFALLFVLTLNFQRKNYIPHNREMWKQGKILEHHSHLVAPDLIELGGLCQISPAYVIRVFVINQERVPRQKIQRHCQRHTLATVNGGVCNRPRRVSPARTGRTGITGQCQLTQWQPG